MAKKRVLITGGSGFIGSMIVKALSERGDEIVILDIVEPKITYPGTQFIKCNLMTDAIPSHLDGLIDSVIHLSGKNIFCRWTAITQKAIYESRVLSTRRLVEAISSWKIKPTVLVSASAFGFYGHAGESLASESTPSGKDFLAHVCIDWEQEAQKVEAAGIRAVQIRTSLVVGPKGLLAPLFLPFKLGLGAWIGSGRAWFPWVHLSDIVSAYLWAIDNQSLEGPVNVSAPELMRQKDFMKIFGAIQHRWVVMTIPIIALKLVYGALASTFNNSAKLSCDKLLSSGFKFQYPTLKEALKTLV